MLFADAPWLLPLLFSAGLAAGWLGAVAGGSGLIALPILLAVGAPPHVAMGTNMLQSSFGNFAATYAFMRRSFIDLNKVRLGVVFTILGAATGAFGVQQLAPDFLKGLLPIVLLTLVIFTLRRRQLGLTDVAPTVPKTVFYVAGGFLLGLYDAGIGAGAGALWTMAFVSGLGFNVAKATAYATALNLSSNIVALSIFLFYDSVWVIPGLIMAAGQVVGGVLGAGQVVTRGAVFVRPIYFAAVIMLLLKLIYDRFRHGV